MKCKCKDWKENQPIIDDAITMSALRGYSDGIKKTFVYCPWCGKAIK